MEIKFLTVILLNYLGKCGFEDIPNLGCTNKRIIQLKHDFIWAKTFLHSNERFRCAGIWGILARGEGQLGESSS